MLEVWRICKARYARAAFSGQGGLRQGGRWHAAGQPVVYASSSRALAAWEYFVQVEPGLAPELVVARARIPAGVKRETLGRAALPPGWDAYPAPDDLRQIGGNWLARRSAAVLAVPSAVISGEWNYLLNPLHPDFRKIKVGPSEPFRYDPRVSRRGF